MQILIFCYRNIQNNYASAANVYGTCDAQPVFNECIERQNTMMDQRCDMNDYSCQCYWYDQIATCYSVCSEDLTKVDSYKLVIQQRTLACSKADALKKAIEATAIKSQAPATATAKAPTTNENPKPTNVGSSNNNKNDKNDGGQAFIQSPPQSTRVSDDYKLNTNNQVENEKIGNNVSLKGNSAPEASSSQGSNNYSRNEKAISESKSSESSINKNSILSTLAAISFIGLTSLLI
ncbi:hypothetical protein AYI69_g7248 [Smittium culicis]|uniref:Uncharacterized protein n=1 Tax=Smittium culicis TaxID=133412 RepID=A0A1R1XTF8_9FUNG|nr:hypothetical protein AYI69_g7248 [Smittium culicis]